MNKPLTAAQMAALKPYESHLRTMVYSGWARNLTTRAFEALKKVFDEKNGKSFYVNPNCAPCVSDMLKKLGKWYFETMAADDAEAAIALKEAAARRDAHEARLRIEAAETIKKEAEQKLADANDRLAEANRLRDEAAKELAAARETRAAAEERMNEEAAEAEEMRAAKTPADGQEPGQISTSSPAPGADTGKTAKAAKKAENKAKPVRAPRNMKPKTN